MAIPFSWNRMNYGGIEKTRIEIAHDRAFARIVVSEELSADSVTVNLENGSWWWRVFPLANGGVDDAATGRLSIIHAATPEPIAPAEGQVYRFRARQGGVRFQWTETEGAEAYLLEAADNPGFSNPALQTQVRGASLTSSNLAPGRWYWRVRPVYPAGAGAPMPSAARSFAIEQDSTLPAPALSGPVNGSSVNVAADARDVYFSWKNEREADTYTIRISPNPNLGSPLVNETLPKNSYAYRPSDALLRPGQYYWAVYQTDSDGNNSPVSATYRFSAVEGVPPPEVSLRALLPPDNYAVTEELLPGIRFAWRTSLPGRTRFQVSATADFSSPVIDEPAAGDAAQGKRLSPGTWYWRIAATADGGTAGTLFQSEARRLSVVSAFPRPTIDSPPPGGRAYPRQDSRLDFRWRAVAGADSYRFSLFRASNRDRPLFETTLNREPAITLDWSRYGEGDYRWTVQAMAEESELRSRRGGLAANASFTVRRAQPVSLDFPAQNAALEGLAALRRPDTARWSTGETLGASRFVLSRNPNPLSGQALMDISNPGKAVTLISLPEGTYYWTVQAANADDFDISPASPASFRVLPVNMSPVRLEQGAAEIPGLDALRRPGTVRWATGETLRSSRFVLSRNPNPLSGEPLMDISNPGKTVTLISLPEGTYYWTVRAETADGIDISAAAPASFRVLPLEIPPVRLEQEAEEIPGLDAVRKPGSVRWATGETVGSSSFILSKNPDPLQGRPVRTTDNPGRDIRLPRLDSGTYYWTIRAETADGLDISARTPARFRVLPIPTLPAPGKQRPEDGYVIGATQLRDTRQIAFSWDRVAATNAYLFSLLDSRGETVHAESLKQTSYTLTDLTILDVGDFYWQVEAVNLDDYGEVIQHGTVMRNRFTIDIPLPNTPQQHDTGTLYGF
jgi:hypothetical protein